MLANVKPKFQWIDVGLLHVPRGDGPTDFQRPLVSEAVVERIARNWHWGLCGTLTVVKVPGYDQYQVGDGGHRTSGARKAGIDALPCVIFEAENMEEAAWLFEKLNQLRFGLFSGELHKARVVQGEEIALKVDEVARIMGRTIMGRRGDRKKQLACVTALRREVIKDIEAATTVARILRQAAAGGGIDQRVLRGLCAIERNLKTQKKSLREYRQRVIGLGGQGLIAAASSLHEPVSERPAGYNCEKAWRDGLLNALNKGQGDRITMVDPPRRRRIGRKKATPVEIASQVGRRRRIAA